MLTCKIMNEILEKAKRDYPIGTKFRSMCDGELTHNSSGVIDDFNGSIYVKDEYYGWWRCIYDKALNQWAEIIEEEPKCTGDCGANYCDENGCTERKRVLCEPFYDKAYNKLAEIIKENTMTQEEFNNGYSVEKMALNKYPKDENWRINSDNADNRHIWIEGFKAHEALVKDKLFTMDDMINSAKYGYEFRNTTSFPEHKFEDSCINNFKQKMQSITKQNGKLNL